MFCKICGFKLVEKTFYIYFCVVCRLHVGLKEREKFAIRIACPFLEVPSKQASRQG